MWSREVIQGSARVSRAVCGVAPQTSWQNKQREMLYEANGETPLVARETRALPDSKFVKKLLLPPAAVRPSYHQT
jgi:hypothetical protein